MKADITRATFRSAKHFHSVVMQQGRVQVDADWNESVDILSGLDETTRIDTIGPHGVPKAGGGFEITVAPDGADLLIGAGRIYVDGLLCESARSGWRSRTSSPPSSSWRGWCWTTGRCNPPTGSSSRTPQASSTPSSRGSARSRRSADRGRGPRPHRHDDGGRDGPPRGVVRGAARSAGT